MKIQQLIVRICCGVSLLVLPFCLAAQIGMNETVVPKSPNAAAFDKLDQLPVDLASGGVNVSYNLYTVKTNSISFPIDLRYHSGGIKTDEMATSVGLGWALSAGGLISRNINGNPDEGATFLKTKKYYLYSSTRGPINAFHGPRGFDTSYATQQYFFNLYFELHIDIGNVSVKSVELNALYQLAQQKNMWGRYTGLELYKGLGNYPQIYTGAQTANADPNHPLLDPDTYSIYTNGLTDPQPDEFSLRTPAYAGKFAFTAQGALQLNPVDNDIKIDYTSRIINNDTILLPVIDGWIVSTSDGKKYYYGYSQNSTTVAEQIEGSRRLMLYKPPTEWYLTKILDSNTMDSVVFNYTRAQVGVGRSPRERITFDKGTCDQDGDRDERVNGIRRSRATHSAAILQSIVTNREIINFYTSKSTSQLSEEPPKIDSIAITDRVTGNKVFQWNLYYEFFRLSKRLKLVAFEKHGASPDIAIPPMVFSYYDTAIAPVILVDTLKQGNMSKVYRDTVPYTPIAQDYWGYFNNQMSNYNGLFVNVAGCPVGANRKAAWPYMQLDVLNKISSPTGGQTILEYEPHSVSAYAGPEIGNSDNPYSMDTIGGLRIRKVTLIDSMGARIARRYSYLNDLGASSGYLNIVPSVTQQISQSLCFADPSMTDYILYSNVNRTPRHNYDNAVNYGQVKEESVNASGVSTGYTIYKFYNDGNSTDTSFLSYKSVGSMPSYEFNGLGNMPDWLSHHSNGVNLLNGYEKQRQIFSADNTLLQQRTSYYSVKQYPGFIAGYDFFTQSMDLCSRADSIWVNSYAILDANSAPVRELIPPSHYYYYIKFYAEYPKSVFISKQVDEMYGQNAAPITNINEFYHESPNHINVTKTIEYNSKGDTLSSVSLYAFDFADDIGGDTTLRQLKAAYYNPLISQTSFKGRNIVSSTVTTYKDFGVNNIRALFPSVTYVHNAIGLAPPTRIFGPGNIASYPVTNYFADDNFRVDQKFIFNSSGNLLQKIHSDGKITSYIWDYRQELPVAEVTGSVKDDIAYTSFEADGTGNWVLGSSSRDGSTAITGTKSYNLANGSISKGALSATKKYLVSYWTRNSTAYTIAGTQPGYPIQGKSVNGWNYFIHQLEGVSGITISGNGAIDELRLYPVASEMQTFTYKPLIGIGSTSDKNNRINYYEYDDLQRLRTVQNELGQVLSQNDYNYAGKAVNLSMSQTFTKSCTTGYQGSSVIYTVPFGKYAAATTAQANQLALNEMNANGQNYANANGSCSYVYKNVEKSGTFTRNNCGTGIGGTVVYTVPAGTYSSLIGQNNADSMAIQDVNQNGQNYANANGTCTYPATVSVKNVNYPNDVGAKISVTVTNTVTNLNYNFSNISGGQTSTNTNIPPGTYNVTITGVAYAPNQAFGIVDHGSGAVISCLPQSGTSYSFSNITFEANKTYDITQISECIAD